MNTKITAFTQKPLCESKLCGKVYLSGTMFFLPQERGRHTGFRIRKGGGIMTYTMVWLAAMIILIIIEIVTVGLTTIWFAIGALVAIIVSMLGGGIILQMTVFLFISLGMLIFTRPLAMRYINNTRTRTNYEGIIGKVVRITQDVDNIAEKGCAVVNGQEWTVRAVNDRSRIAAGSLAKVVDIKGVRLIVEKYEEG